MKIRLYAFLLTVMLPFLSIGGNAQSISINPAENSSAEISASSKRPGDSVIQIPDRNFEAVVRASIGKSEGDITAGDVAEITELEVNSLGITDLTGIEHFIALRRLDCSMNRLTSLNVSRNTALESLSCDMNNLAVLNVDQNAALKTLSCEACGVEALNLSRNVALEFLGCSMNKLKTLDTSQNPALKNLYCDGNQLAVLDVDRNHVLGRLSCDGNRLTSLDVSQNPKLESLTCDGNQLAALDVSRNPALWFFSCKGNQLASLDVSHNVELGWFYCDDNQLLALDVSRNAKLKGLTCSINQLMELDVSQNVALEYLDAQNNLFPDLSAVLRMSEDMPWSFGFDPQGRFETSPPPQLPGDTIIEFPDPIFEAAVREEIGKPMGDITAADVAKITTLRVDKLDISDLTGIEYFTALEVLRCEGNQLTELDVSKNTKLIHLYCQWNQLATLNVSHEAPLQTIHCYNNQLKMLDVRLAPSDYYCELYCYYNLFPDKFAILLWDSEESDPERIGAFVFEPQIRE